jgi:hypothetical protein
MGATSTGVANIGKKEHHSQNMLLEMHQEQAWEHQGLGDRQRRLGWTLLNQSL